MSWPVASLGEIAGSVDYGVTASADAKPVGPKFLRITDIQDDKVDWASVPFCDADARKLSSALLVDGDIVFARTGATTGKSFLVRDPPKSAVFASYLIRVRPSERLDSSYLSHFFRSPDYWNQVASSARGAAQPGINATVLKSLMIPVAPITEQRRIAAILDKADAIRRKREHALTLADDLLRSVFLEMFGDPSTNSKGWPVGSIRDLIVDAKYGTSQKADVEEGSYPVLRMGNLTYSGRIDTTDLKYLDLKDNEIEKYTVRRGDILFNRTNSRELVGKTAVVMADKVYAYAGYLVRARTNSRANPHYISAFLNSTFGKATLQGMCKSIIGMANINAQEFQNIRIPVPPVDLQNRFGAVLERTEATRQLLMADLRHATDLFAALSQRAFAGNL
jgi:type I restriction enzyme, S subunit